MNTLEKFPRAATAVTYCVKETRVVSYSTAVLTNVGREILN